MAKGTGSSIKNFDKWLNTHRGKQNSDPLWSIYTLILLPIKMSQFADDLSYIIPAKIFDENVRYIVVEEGIL